ncbi:precorrin-6A/cobalt-precorrin-6A reductase [Kribbella sp. VKM Ac-2569]|uniref:cobalt-precorrin-6A reductase n=1 Tax=Kribbella sp. VKM Ac-2569 TaxID=2512220 RepID=UPI00102BD166|nr:cobalt-precorrin-6A reductase [Kribbella sp. VKM Ac-2569]RZT19554.1 precorrin-6A/cobalt-precorrin-6A reductase [Kribbella sp. VKM Ac-2569]
MKVLLLGGTGEARELAGLLAKAGVEVVSSLAGRTADARVPVGEVRVGGFGGVGGLAGWLREHRVDAVIDATHPFAANITANAVAATREVGTPLLVLRRPGWAPEPGDNWHWVDSASGAAELLPGLGTRVFLTVGRQGLDAFAGTGLRTLARCVDPPEPRPTWCTLILARGPFTVADEETILRDHGIDVLVTKDSGGPATTAKLTAARRLAIPVVVIHRPALPAGPEVVETVAEAVQWVMRASHSPST